MDISFSVYSAAGAVLPPRPATHIDEDAELARPKPLHLSEPRLIYPDANEKPSEPRLSSGSHPAFDAELVPSSMTTKSKHESFNLSGSVFLITSDGKTLDLPIPSNSRYDPLNWGRWKTAGAMFALGWYSVVALTAVQAVSLMLHGIEADFSEEDIKPWTVETLVTAPTLFMGIGAFAWVPLSLALGRRPVFLLAALVIFLATIGAGYSRTYHELLLSLSILGMGEGFALTLAFLMVIDMTFINQRPHAVAAWWSIAGSIGVGALSLVPYLSNYSQDWHLFYQRWSILTGISLMLAFFLFPETYFKRPTVAFDGLILMQTATEKLTVYEDLEADSGIYRDLPDYPSTNTSGVRKMLDRVGLSRSPFASWKSMGICYLHIAFCAINPLIFWVLIASSFNFAGMMFIGATYAEVLASPPYNLRSASIMHVNNSSALGSLLSYPFTVYTLCKILTRLSKRNKGVREAEHYLIGYIPTVIAGGLSTLLYGLAVDRHWHTSVYYVSYGLNGFSWVSMAIVMTLWVTEAFPRWAAPALVVVGGGSYLISFTMSFALVPWIAAHGYLLVGVELTILQFVGGLIAVPIAFWGKSARQKIHGRWANERGGALRPL